MAEVRLLFDPKKVRKPPALKDMIKEAIYVLKERNGSSRQAIKKYIALYYRYDVDAKARFITTSLKKGVTDGTLVQVKNSFKLSPEAKKVAKKKEDERKKKLGIKEDKTRVGTKKTQKKKDLYPPIMILPPAENPTKKDLTKQLNQLKDKFYKACDQLHMIDRKVKDTSSRYTAANKAGNRVLRYNKRIQLVTLEGVRAAFYEYAIMTEKRMSKIRSALKGDLVEDDYDSEEDLIEDGDSDSDY